MSGEILRAVLDESAIIRRPKWYVCELPHAAYSANVEQIGQFTVKPNTMFLWTTFGFNHCGFDERSGYVSDYGESALIQFTDLQSGQRFSNQPAPAVLVQSPQSGQMELEEYPLFPGRYRLQWTVTPLKVNLRDSYYLTFGGIEFVMPKPNSAYNVPDLGG